MRRFWILFAAILVIPLSYSDSTASMIDLTKLQFTCRPCMMNCTEFGFKQGESICHLKGDTTTYYSQSDMEYLQQKIKEMNVSSPRVAARSLEKKRQISAKINLSKESGCYPSLNADGKQEPPLLTQYASLGELGQYFTSIACQNPPDSVPNLMADGNFAGDISVTLKRIPDPVLKKTMAKAGFKCENEKDAMSCTRWSIPETLFPASVLKPLMLFAGQIKQATCSTCAEQRRLLALGKPPLLTLANKVTSSSSSSSESSQFTVPTTQILLTEDKWKKHYCDQVAGFCIAVYEKWYLTAVRDAASQAVYLVVFADSKGIPIDQSPYRVWVTQTSTAPDGTVKEINGSIVVFRKLNETTYFQFSGPPEQKLIVQYLANTLTPYSEELAGTPAQ